MVLMMRNGKMEKKEIYRKLSEATWNAVSDCGQWGDQYGFKIRMLLEDDDGNEEDIVFVGGTCYVDEGGVEVYDEDDFKRDGGKW